MFASNVPRVTIGHPEDHIHGTTSDAMPKNSAIVFFNRYEYVCVVKFPNGAIRDYYLKDFIDANAHSFIDSSSMFRGSANKAEPFKHWTNENKRHAQSAVERHINLILSKPEIRIIDGQLIDYWTLDMTFTVNPIEHKSNDEYVPIRRHQDLCVLIKKLENIYLYEERIDTDIIKELLAAQPVVNAEDNYAKDAAVKGMSQLSLNDSYFWVSLKTRLQHLLEHPESITVFELKLDKKGRGWWHDEYKHPLAMAQLMRGMPYELEQKLQSAPHL